MAIGLLTHKGCGGTVIMVPHGLSLTAPVFTLNTKGISNVVVEATKLSDNVEPHWICNKCDKEFSKDELDTDVTALCRVGNHIRVVGELWVTGYTPCVCDDCVDSLAKGNIPTEPMFIENSNPSKTRLSTVLTKEFPI